MICIKCSHETKVINSRPHKKTPSVWRRRQCLACGTTFTTHEIIADDAYQLTVVATDKVSTPFSLPRLLLSLAVVLAHRPNSADDAYWLAQTIAEQAQASATDRVSDVELAELAYEALENFDATAALQYGARHGLIKNTAQRGRRGRPRVTRRAH